MQMVGAEPEVTPLVENLSKITNPYGTQLGEHFGNAFEVISEANGNVRLQIIGKALGQFSGGIDMMVALGAGANKMEEARELAVNQKLYGLLKTISPREREYLNEAMYSEFAMPWAISMKSEQQLTGYLRRPRI